MKRTGFWVFAIVILGVVLYLTFVIAVIKLMLGLIILAVAAVLLWFLWHKIKDKVEDKF